MKSKLVSIVVPVFNEEGNVKPLYHEIASVLKKTPYEIIFVDDGSSDTSFITLKQIATKTKNVKVIKLLSNYGQSNAIAAGIAKSRGTVIVTMDSDMQHDPKDILPMIKKLEEGYHVVCGWRVGRNKADAFLTKSLPSKISNILVRFITGQKLNDSTGGMRVFDRKVVETVPMYGEMHRYLPILAAWKGFKVTEIPISIRKRHSGKSKYNFKRIFRGFLDLLTIKYFISYSTRPIHIFGTIGILSFLVGFTIDIVFAYLKIFNGYHLTRDVPSLVLGIMFILMGIMFLGFGFIADLISHESVSSERRRTYIIDNTINTK